jgi:hypothetical protein
MYLVYSRMPSRIVRTPLNLWAVSRPFLPYMTALLPNTKYEDHGLSHFIMTTDGSNIGFNWNF